MLSGVLVVSYDLPNDRRRTRLANALEDFGVRVQYSVFECLLTPDQIERLRTRMASLLDPAEDSVRIYRLCQGLCREDRDPRAGQGDRGPGRLRGLRVILRGGYLKTDVGVEATSVPDKKHASGQTPSDRAGYTERGKLRPL